VQLGRKAQVPSTKVRLEHKAAQEPKAGLALKVQRGPELRAQQALARKVPREREPKAAPELRADKVQRGPEAKVQQVLKAQPERRVHKAQQLHKVRLEHKAVKERRAQALKVLKAQLRRKVRPELKAVLAQEPRELPVPKAERARKVQLVLMRFSLFLKTQINHPLFLEGLLALTTTSPIAILTVRQFIPKQLLRELYLTGRFACPKQPPVLPHSISELITELQAQLLTPRYSRKA
jgi:hypothetical protein